MNYLQSILWAILAALCVVQFEAKLPPPPDWMLGSDAKITQAPVTPFRVWVHQSHAVVTQKFTIIEVHGFKLDQPFIVPIEEQFEVDFNPITTEIKINGVIVRKGNLP